MWSMKNVMMNGTKSSIGIIGDAKLLSFCSSPRNLKELLTNVSISTLYWLMLATAIASDLLSKWNPDLAKPTKKSWPLLEQTIGAPLTFWGQRFSSELSMHRSWSYPDLQFLVSMIWTGTENIW